MQGHNPKAVKATEESFGEYLGNQRDPHLQKLLRQQKNPSRDPHLQKLLRQQKNPSDAIDPDEQFHVGIERSFLPHVRAFR
nr:hypothetical protein [Tanacetum cinerariifolium]